MSNPHDDAEFIEMRNRLMRALGMDHLVKNVQPPVSPDLVILENNVTASKDRRGRPVVATSKETQKILYQNIQIVRRVFQEKNILMNNLGEEGLLEEEKAIELKLQLIPGWLRVPRTLLGIKRIVNSLSLS